MNCPNCRSEMVSSFDEPYHYVDCGLSNVYLEGVEVRRCANCGELSVSIPGIEALHRTLAQTLVKKTHRFTGKEIRFLRKYLGLSAERFAIRAGVGASTVSRWENEHEQMASTADRFLRMLVLHESPIDDYSVEQLDLVDTVVASSHLRARRVNKSWRGEESRHSHAPAC